MADEKITFAQDLRDGRLLIGTIVALPSPEITEILARVGYDWLFIDAEHGPFLPQSALPMLQAAGKCPCAIRVPVGDAIWIAKALDIGADAIIIPRVDTAEQAQRAVLSAKYPPGGNRGIGLGRAHGYGTDGPGYLSRANRDTAIIIQIESGLGVRNAASISRIEGVDAILIGPNDLAASLGCLGELDAPVVRNAIDEVTAACHRTGTKLGVFGATAGAIVPYIERGFTLLAVGVDSLFLIESATQTLHALRPGS